jgi:hypothetical protein
MCDYSLHAMVNRLAVEGERLVVHRFPTSSLGLASPSELQALAETQAVQKKPGFWSALRSLIGVEDVQPVTAVCIPPGAQLFLQDIPRHLQKDFGVGNCEEVTLTQLSARPNTYRDAVRFSNGREVLLQRLEPGQRVSVLCLSLVDEAVDQESMALVH